MFSWFKCKYRIKEIDIVNDIWKVEKWYWYFGWDTCVIGKKEICEKYLKVYLKWKKIQY